MAKTLFKDTSNYSRKERGEIKIHDEEWRKIAEVLNVPVDEIKDIVPASQHNENFCFYDQSGNNVNHYNVPEVMMNNTQEYIQLLKEQIELLKEEINRLKSQQ